MESSVPPSMEPHQPSRPADRSDWTIHPLPQERTTIGFDRPFDEEELAFVRLGSIPELMEDKWFVYFADNQLFFHRSWTGHCIYVAHFRATEDGALLVSADINRDRDQYSATDDALDGQLLLYLIDSLLLGREGDVPGDPDNPLKLWTVVGRLMLGQRPGDR